LPALVRCESGDALRIFPRTVVRYKLPSTTNFRRLRATLAPVPNSREPMTVQVRAGSTSKNFSVVPNTADVEVDIDLGRASEIEISVDSSGTISYPCGVEWQSAFITEDRRP